MRPIFTLILSAALLLAGGASGEDVYRTLDEEGNVTYTDVPPAEDGSAEPISMPAAPSTERVNKSEKKSRDVIKAAKEADRKRQEKKRQRTERVNAAEKKLAEAEAKLAETKEIRDDDRQHLAGGKRRIRPEYFERVEQAEKELEQARKELRKARGY